jgi:16S rRNA (uracil1498-N3)-methyltransferase
MHLVYCHTAASSSDIMLDEPEAYHLQVLRTQVGDAIEVFDGQGGLYAATVVTISKKGVSIQIQHLIKQHTPPSPQLHLAIAPTKNTERYDWLVEKAVEMGISHITPLICKHSERRDIRMDRLQKIIISAAKQSLNLHLPILHPTIKFDAFIAQQADTIAVKCIAHCAADTRPLQQVLSPRQDALILIGPEGDFGAGEIDTAVAAGYHAISLGQSRLRTETAGIYATAVFRYHAELD